LRAGSLYRYLGKEKATGGSRPKKGEAMRKPKWLVLTAALGVSALLLMGPAASAVTNFGNAPSGAHYRQQNVEPMCTSTTNPNGSITVSCTGTQIAGVGNTNANLSLGVNATANFVCRNPGSKKAIVEPHSGSASESVGAVLTPSRNGTLVVPAQSVTITPEDAAAQFECPNPNWTEEFTGFSGTSFTYSVTFVGFSAPVISLP